MSAALVDTDPLQTALARIAELEAELETLRRTPPTSKPRRSKATATAACQYCADTKVPKKLFLGLPVCADWRPCASRIRRRREAGTAGFAYDLRYTVKRAFRDAEWVARFDGDEIARGMDRGEVRATAAAHRDALVAVT